MQLTCYGRERERQRETDRQRINLQMQKIKVYNELKGYYRISKTLTIQGTLYRKCNYAKIIYCFMHTHIMYNLALYSIRITYNDSFNSYQA